MPGKFFSPSSSPWNTPLGITPVHSSNTAYKASLQTMVTTNSTGWWINRESYSSPIYSVRASLTPTVPVTLVNDAGSPFTKIENSTNPAFRLAWLFAQGVPIPDGAVAANGTDEHMCVIDTDTGKLWEMWLMEYNTRGISGWSCRWGGWLPNHRVNIGIFESPTWGATATSLPLVAGMMLDADLRRGVIPHALQVIVPDPKDGAVWPAQRGDGTPGNLIPEGSRFRIKASVNVNTYSTGGGQATATLRMIAKALQDYGAVINDRTGSGGVVAFRAEPVANPYDWGGYPNNILNAIPFADLEFISDDYRPPVVPRVSTSTVEQIGFVGF